MDFDPAAVKCVDWRKIAKTYRLSQYEVPSGCAVCQKPCSTKCSGCFRVGYCSAAHQRDHWHRIHKLKCSPFKIAFNDGVLGRFVVASRDIKAGEVIIEEQPVTIGPKQFTSPVCLGCHKNVGFAYLCSVCQWPVCGTECEGRSLHRIECATLAQGRFKPNAKHCNQENGHNPIYECITPLRCILIKRLVHSNWNVMTLMEQHTLERQKEPLYPINQTNTVKFLLEHYGLSHLTNDAEINAMMNVLDVNAFEIRTDDCSIRGVYPLTAMMNSVCSPNTQNCIGSDFTCRVRAVRDIAQGEEVTATYTLTLSGTLFRRKHLLESKYFACKCERCADPEELGSHFSTLRCPPQSGCGKGLVTPRDPLDSQSSWVCDKCQSCMPHQDVEALLEHLEQENQAIGLDQTLLEDRVRTLDHCLHPHHNLILDLKFTLCQLYGQTSHPEPEVMLKEAKAKRKLCLEILGVMDSIVPGQFRLRGMFLFELYVVSMFLWRQEEASLSERAFQNGLEGLQKTLLEAIEILNYEPEQSIEGRRCKTAKAFQERLSLLMKH